MAQTNPTFDLASMLAAEIFDQDCGAGYTLHPDLLPILEKLAKRPAAVIDYLVEKARSSIYGVVFAEVEPFRCSNVPPPAVLVPSY